MPKPHLQKFVKGYRPAVYARHGRMLGIRQPLDGPVFENFEEALHWCIDAMANHYDRRLGMSDGRIESFKGMVDCKPPSDPIRLRDIQRICELLAKGKPQSRNE